MKTLRNKAGGGEGYFGQPSPQTKTPGTEGRLALSSLINSQPGWRLLRLLPRPTPPGLRRCVASSGLAWPQPPAFIALRPPRLCWRPTSDLRRLSLPPAVPRCRLTTSARSSAERTIRIRELCTQVQIKRFVCIAGPFPCRPFQQGRQWSSAVRSQKRKRQRPKSLALPSLIISQSRRISNPSAPPSANLPTCVERCVPGSLPATDFNLHHPLTLRLCWWLTLRLASAVTSPGGAGEPADDLLLVHQLKRK